VRALGVEAAQPEPEAKEAAWLAAVDERRVPTGSLGGLAAAFWQPGQREVLVPFVERFTEALPDIGRTGMVVAITVTSTMFPVVGPDRTGLTRLREAAASDEVTPLVRRIVIERSEQVGHMLDARAR
jgi:aminopeptidase N